MIDIKMNNRGDIVLFKDKVKNSFKLVFGRSLYPLFKLQYIQNERLFSLSNKNKYPRCNITFMTGSSQKKVMAKSIIDKEELKQRIIIKLRTELGSLPDFKDFGSLLVTTKHDDIHRKGVMESVQRIVEQEILNMGEENIVVIVRQGRNETPFYLHNLNVYIYQDGVELYNFSLGV